MNNDKSESENAGNVCFFITFLPAGFHWIFPQACATSFFLQVLLLIEHTFVARESMKKDKKGGPVQTGV